MNSVVSFIQRILKIFGISSFEKAEETGSAASKEETAFPYVKELVDFRKAVRAAAKVSSKKVFVLLRREKRDKNLKEKTNKTRISYFFSPLFGLFLLFSSFSLVSSIFVLVSLFSIFFLPQSLIFFFCLFTSTTKVLSRAKNNH